MWSVWRVVEKSPQNRLGRGCRARRTANSADTQRAAAAQTRARSRSSTGRSTQQRRKREESATEVFILPTEALGLRVCTCFTCHAFCPVTTRPVTTRLAGCAASVLLSRCFIFLAPCFSARRAVSECARCFRCLWPREVSAAERASRCGASSGGTSCRWRVALLLLLLLLPAALPALLPANSAWTAIGHRCL